MKNLIIFFIFFTIPAFCADYSSLVERSPFQRTRSSAPDLPVDTTTDNKNFELHGIWSFNGTTVFSIHDNRQDANIWVPLGSEQSGIGVIKFYPEIDAVEAKLPNGETCVLKLHKPTIRPEKPQTFGPLINQMRSQTGGQIVDEEARKRFLKAMEERDK